MSRNAPTHPAVDSLLDSLRAHGMPSATATQLHVDGARAADRRHAARAGARRGAGLSVLRQDRHDAGVGVAAAPGGHNIAVDPSLLVSLDAQIGDTVSIGLVKFVITGTLKSVPGDVGISAAIGPRVYIPERYVGADGAARLRQPRRVRDAVQGCRERVSGFSRHALLAAAVCRGRTARCVRRGYNESRLANAIDQLHDYLAIVGLVALLLGGIGVASGVHAFAMRKIDPVAILRCLGATSWQVLAIYTAQAAVMGFVGAAAGVVLGVGIQFVMPRVLPDFLPVDVTLHLEPSAILLGLGDRRVGRAAVRAAAARRAAPRVAAAGAAPRAGRGRACAARDAIRCAICCRSPSWRACSSWG